MARYARCAVTAQVTVSTCCGGARLCGWHGSRLRQTTPPFLERSASRTSAPWRQPWPTRRPSSCSRCGGMPGWIVRRLPGGWYGSRGANWRGGARPRLRRLMRTAALTRTTTRRLARTLGRQNPSAPGSRRGGLAHAAGALHRSSAVGARVAALSRADPHPRISVCCDCIAPTSMGCGPCPLTGLFHRLSA